MRSRMACKRAGSQPIFPCLNPGTFELRGRRRSEFAAAGACRKHQNCGVPLPAMMLEKTHFRLLFHQRTDYSQAKAQGQLRSRRAGPRLIDEREASSRATTAQANENIAAAVDEGVAEQCVQDLLAVAPIR